PTRPDQGSIPARARTPALAGLRGSVGVVPEAVVHWSLVTGHWSLVTGHWSLVACQPRRAGRWDFATAGHWSCHRYRPQARAGRFGREFLRGTELSARPVTIASLAAGGCVAQATRPSWIFALSSPARVYGGGNTLSNGANLCVR